MGLIETKAQSILELNKGKSDLEITRLQELFRVRYFNTSNQDCYGGSPWDLYKYSAIIGDQEVKVEKGDCVYFFGADCKENDAHINTITVMRGPCIIDSKHLAVVIRGYMPDEKMVRIGPGTQLPYVNGCSTKQLIEPSRLGDPTVQMLYIPPYSAEQAHHIHSTVRVVLVAGGRGVSVVGMENGSVEEELVPGKVCILDPLVPHHFETPYGEPVLVYPIHIFSSTQSESNHPMFNGTHMMNQGGP